MLTIFTFKSEKFNPTPAELDEDSEDNEEFINPGLFGRELADFLESQLKSHGYTIQFRCAEDWGYWQEVQHSGKYTMAIGCSNLDVDEQGHDSHRVFVLPNTPEVRPMQNWFRKIDVREDVEKLVGVLGEILRSDNQISDIELLETLD